MKFFALFVLFAAGALAQDQPGWARQIAAWSEAVERHALEPVNYYKASVDAGLAYTLRVTDADAPLPDDQLTHVHLIPLAAAVDSPPYAAAAAGPPYPAQAPAPSSTPPTTNPPRARVSFSPGAKLGKGFYSWPVELCNNSTDSGQQIDSGLVVEAAIASGIPYAPASEASIANTAQRNRSVPVVSSNVAAGFGHAGALLLAAGVIAAKATPLVSVLVGTQGAESLSKFFSSQATPDFSSRFPNQLGDTLALGPGACTQSVLFARKTKGAKPIARVPIQ